MKVNRTELHCELCGRLVGQECDVYDGYTSCCNELVCDGTNKYCEKCDNEDNK